MATPSKLAPYVWPQVDANGNPYSGALLYTYLNNTTTPAATYTTPAGTTANANPIVFSTLGEPSNGVDIVEVCIPDTVVMTFVLKTSTGDTIATWNDLRGINDFDPANIAEWYTTTYTGTSVLTYLSGSAPGNSSFSIVTASDQTSVFHVGRRIKIYDGTAYHYGTIATSVSSGGGLLQTLTFTDMDPYLTGAFSNTPALYYGILSSTNPAIPKVVLPDGSTATTQAAATNDTTIATTAFVTTANNAASVAPSVQNFRLSLTTAVPVTTSDVSSSTSVYVVPYTGKKIGLYYSSAWVIVTSAEVTLALGTITSDLGYDVFCYTTDGTTLSVELLAWTSTIARATALAYQDGVLVKATDSTRRYMGSFLTISTTTTCDTEAKRYLWNNYHRVTRSLKYPIATASWLASTSGGVIATWRQANADTANQVMLFAGLVEDAVSCTYLSTGSNSGAGVTWCNALGLNTSAAPTGFNTVGQSSAANGKNSTNTMLVSLPILGKNYVAAMEYSVSAVANQTWYGTTALAVSGLYGHCRA